MEEYWLQPPEKNTDKARIKKNKNGKKNNCGNISSDKQATFEIIWTLIRKGNLKRESESFLIAAQKNAIRINYITVRDRYTQQNSKCSLCGDRDETMNYIISECSKLVQMEYKARHDCVGEDDPLGLVQGVEIWPNEQMLYAKNRICPGESDTQNSLVFWVTNRSSNLCQTSRPFDSQKKKEEAARQWTSLSRQIPG